MISLLFECKSFIISAQLYVTFIQIRFFNWNLFMDTKNTPKRPRSFYKVISLSLSLSLSCSHNFEFQYQKSFLLIHFCGICLAKIYFGNL